MKQTREKVNDFFDSSLLFTTTVHGKTTTSRPTHKDMEMPPASDRPLSPPSTPTSSSVLAALFSRWRRVSDARPHSGSILVFVFSGTEFEPDSQLSSSSGTETDPTRRESSRFSCRNLSEPFVPIPRFVHSSVGVHVP